MVGKRRVDLCFSERVGGVLGAGQEFFVGTKGAGAENRVNPAINVCTWPKHCGRVIRAEGVETGNIQGVISSFNPAWFSCTIQG